ncbi:hypothetical protein [Nocardia sp. NPDC051570]|uniref:hypothetical protein n=1 Tax=Nocardia sp. NPDC051570 TaxID=3364324 RepID=UPI003794F07D
MRIAVLTALVLLAAGCSLANDTPGHPVPSAFPATTVPSSPTSAAPAPPSQGAPVAEVIAWVRSATPADPTRYGTATTADGAATPLGGDISFTSPSGKIKCTTDFQDGLPNLSCLVDLKNPPARPAGSANGNWVGNWIDYSGTALSVGSLRGDPGPFTRGIGAVLPYGHRVTVQDYTCRIDQTGLLCVHAAAKSGVRINDAGVIPFGCLEEHTLGPKETVGQAFRC